MEILPSSAIYLIRNCPLTNSYKDTVYFEDRGEQHDYFVRGFGKQNVYCEGVSYQRYALGVITLKGVAEDLYDVNYMMFQNTGFGLKWFYAFVNLVEYVNNRTVRIHYQIDVIQTWMFDYKIEPCMVLRNHTKTDVVGENITPEPFSITEYTHQSVVYEDRGQWCLMLEFERGTTGILDLIDNNQSIKPSVVGGIFRDTYILVLTVDSEEDVELMSDLLDSLEIITLSGLVGAYMCPRYWAEWHILGPKYNPDYRSFTTFLPRPTSLNGYSNIKNKKLLTAPYVWLSVNNNRGNSCDYAFELFNGDAGVTIHGGCGSNDTLIATPAGEYNGITNSGDYAVSLGKFPVVPIVGSRFAEWLANDGLQQIVGMLAGITFTLAGGSLMSGTLAATAPMLPTKPIPPVYHEEPIPLKDLLQYDYSSYNAYIAHQDTRRIAQADKIAGSVGGMVEGMLRANGGSNSYPTGVFGVENMRSFTMSVKTIRAYQAKIIDDYFTMFGYAIGNIQMPSFNNRPYFTYIQTEGFSGHGGVPSDDMRKICDIHDSGITYWKNGSVVGDYTQNNSV